MQDNTSSPYLKMVSILIQNEDCAKTQKSPHTSDDARGDQGDQAMGNWVKGEGKAMGGDVGVRNQYGSVKPKI